MKISNQLTSISSYFSFRNLVSKEFFTVAVALGAIALVAYTLSRRVHLEHKTNLQRNLGLYCKQGNIEMVRAALKAGVDVNAPDTAVNRFAPIHLACFNGHFEIVQLLIDHKANVNARSDTGQTPLHIASLRAHARLIPLLVKSGAEINSLNDRGQTPLHLACLQLHFDREEHLIDAKMDFSVRDLLTNNSWTYMQEPFAHTVEELLKHADPNAIDSSRNTPLHYASMNKNSKIIKLLCARGVDLHAKTSYDSTPLHLACGEGCDNIIIELLNSRARIDMTDRAGDTPLHTALLNYQHNAAATILSYASKLLLKNICDRESTGQSQHLRKTHKNFVNPQNNVGETPLHLAVRNTQRIVPLGKLVRMASISPKDMVEILLEAGAQLLPDEFERTPLDLARGDPELLAVFRKYLIEKI